MTPEQILGIDRAHVWHPYASQLDPAPVFPVASASGVRLRLADGRELIDGMSSWWSAIHGYNHPVLNEAAKAQIDCMSHVMFGGLTHAPAAALCQRLVDITPAGLDKVFLCDSGSVAVEVGIKMALQYQLSRGSTQRNELLTIRGGYHGDTFATMALCDPITGMHHLFSGFLSQHHFAPRPPAGFHTRISDADTADIAALLDARGDRIAALVLEPVVQGAGGMYFYPPAWLAAVRALCNRHGVLLVADEIATGFGRTGTLFACEHADISPDILCLGKALTGGYLSLAATLCTGAVARGICEGEAGVLMHGPTFMANPLACAIADASIDLLLGGDWRADIARLEAGLDSGLAPAAGLPGVADVRVLGGIGVIELTEPVDMAIVQSRFVEAGVWVRPFGRLVYTMPPYIIDDADLGHLCAAMVEVVASLA